ncbi:MAG: acyl-CoA thioesterase [Desulfobulbaceae bacterium]|uniref:Acyl-CoA thioesterase n=1 Tax=Candidatus Desulfatifera sulfidica TaxID=2841691 RepID=A0A8J6NC33_9BACT|nr:acyl-CoA thioesterase [Candidatus Desulfatifera sulfidica]
MNDPLSSPPAKTPQIHRCQTRVLYGDTDAAAVVYNANYLRYFEQGRTELMRELVCSYQEIEALGLVMPVTECHIRFKAPARYDDLLTIETRLLELKKVSCTFSYRILRYDAGQDRPKLLARGTTTHAAVTRDGKLCKLPEEIRTKMATLL